jgi:hypothetical protein
MMVTITDIIEFIYGILVYRNTYVDNDGYYNRHHRTYLCYTGLLLYLHLTILVAITYIIELIYCILVYLILTVDIDSYYNRYRRTYLWYTGPP